ncbi:hypothetical protein GCM10010387_29970 [Streptomyces inusitatus]|uniref:Peptidase S8/S53 domain-containing protein n=1 Tax=Streptomyces inusitatus TaxID=68221 RepID=A0A918UTV2_9ACTN|nr:S8 family serine peptidase [Streptomyces inusitatus]GGZ33778.1 hypothetical protein GCM10010387_29970 [Streptomyces inusitatus]
MGSGQKGLPGHRITLITGDRVQVDARGRVVGVEPAQGREKVPMHTRTGQGRTLVIPADAQRLISDGTLDERLFDITELNSRESRAVYGDGVKVIVGYRGTAGREAGSGIRAAAGTTARSLASLNADAVTVPARDAAAFWETLTRTADGGHGRTAAAGVDRISLDGVYTARFDPGKARADAAGSGARVRRAGYDGTGVKIAVLDSGVDGTHRDLAGRVVAERNFSRSPDSEDRYGQGTQVASVAAGTGAASNGVHRGVAPGAEVLSGKVLDDGGSTTVSAVIAGIDWAVAQGADIVNLSFSASGRPESDPLETHIDRVTAERGVLFTVMAGDRGPKPRSIESPGRTEGALTVGAVDGQDRLAGFSAVGPGLGGGIKPDLTAPGVNITAAATAGTPNQNPPGYVPLSGTWIAAPHVAGAAALLKQRHPKWKSAELKSALTGSAKNGTHQHTPFEQGTGRVAADRALEQRVFAEPSTVTFGTQRYPHTDDTPVTRSIAYRNIGGEDLTLDLTVTSVGPDGKPAPEGFLTLGRNRITVPAGGTASVELTADTRLGGDVNGVYAATVVASGGGQSVRTTAGVEREVESYDLTVRHIDRHGQPGRDFRTWIRPVGTGGKIDKDWLRPGDGSGTVTTRLPRGAYTLDSVNEVDPLDSTKGLDVLSRPELSVDRDMTLTVDARTARPVDITPPDAGAKPFSVSMHNRIKVPGFDSIGSSLALPSFENFRTAHLGPDITDGSLTQSWTGHWSKGDSVQYSTVHGGVVQRLATGHVKRFKDRDLAKVRLRLGASAPGKRAGVWVIGDLPHQLPGFARTMPPQRAPGVRTLYLSGGDGATWTLYASQFGEIKGKAEDEPETTYHLPRDETFRPGKTYTRTMNTPVFAPRITEGEGVFREEDSITGALRVFSDGAGNYGGSKYSSVKTTLHRGKTRIGENTDPLTGDESFAVGPADAPYTLSTSVTRSPELAKAGSRIDASWTFRSQRPGTEEKVALPVSVARLKAAVSPDGTAPAGRTQRVPVTVQGAAAGGNLRSLEVSASYDHGRTWKKLPVTRGGVTVGNPAKGKAITFRSVVTDKKGNKGTVTLYNAYFGK